MSKTRDDDDVPSLTEADVRSALSESAAGANALLRDLNDSHRRDYTRAMSLHLD